MVVGNTKVHCLDIYEERSIIKSIEEIFQMYSSRMNFDSSTKEFTIDLRNYDVKIHDLFGWTKVECLKKRHVSPKDWRELHVSLVSKPITMTSDSVIAVYPKIESIRGFHGETKYPYEIRNIHMINDNEKIRLVNKPDPNISEIIFSEPTLTSSSCRYDHAYEIYTKSGFYNAENFHLFSSLEDNILSKSGYK